MESAVLDQTVRFEAKSGVDLRSLLVDEPYSYEQYKVAIQENRLLTEQLDSVQAMNARLEKQIVLLREELDQKIAPSRELARLSRANSQTREALTKEHLIKEKLEKRLIEANQIEKQQASQIDSLRQKLLVTASAEIRVKELERSSVQHQTQLRRQTQTIAELKTKNDLLASLVKSLKATQVSGERASRTLVSWIKKIAFYCI
jgi:hypothetical protein